MSSFPLPASSVLRLNLLNNRHFHGDFSDKMTDVVLKKSGDYLFRNNTKHGSLLLSVRDGEVTRDFELTILEEGHSLVLRLGSRLFDSIDDVIAFHEKHPIRTSGHHVLLTNPIVSNRVGSRLGIWSHALLSPRHTAPSLVTHSDTRVQSAILSLNAEAAREVDDDALEGLIQINHIHILALRDFSIVNTLKYPLITLRFDDFESTLGEYMKKDSTDIGIADCTRWIAQAASAVSFLMDQDLFSIVLSVHDCVMESALTGHSIKLCSYFGTNTMISAWRYVAPELLLGEFPSCASLVWNMGVFIWQIFTLGKLEPFQFCPSTLSFLRALADRSPERDACTLLPLPGTTLPEHMDPLLKRVVGEQLRVIKSCPTPTDEMRSLCMDCIRIADDARPGWSRVVGVTNSESKILTIASYVNRLKL